MKRRELENSAKSRQLEYESGEVVVAEMTGAVVLTLTMDSR